MDPTTYLVRVVPFNVMSIESYKQLHASLQDLKHPLRFILWKCLGTPPSSSVVSRTSISAYRTHIYDAQLAVEASLNVMAHAQKPDSSFGETDESI